MLALLASSAGSQTPAWAVAPFAVYLLLIAILPLFLGHFWERNRNKLLLALLVSAPVVAHLLFTDPHGAERLLETGREYVSFIALLAALFVISGGIYLRGSLAGTPLVNTALLAVGTLLASVIGTTGASALLIRPLLRANASRQRTTHIVIFFIFVVSNGAGMLTPLGDPPLFLGFLRGVPFSWTLQLAAPWAMVNGALLLLFNLWDQQVLNREERERPGAQLEDVQKVIEPLRVEGGVNFVWLLGIVGLAFFMGTAGPRLIPAAPVRAFVHVFGMLALLGLSLLSTPRRIHTANRFTWAPIQEVAVVFVGIFLTMIPALAYLEQRGASFGITEPWQFFWAAGGLSSFLDNAPTYLTFASLATSVVNQGAEGLSLSASNLGSLAAHPKGERLLAAISCGAVFMGAVTYIGNGPNFMVKAIAEQHGVRMPGFFRYLLWSIGILMPLFALVALLFFR